MTSFQAPEIFNVASYCLGERIAAGQGDRVALRLPDGERTYAEVQELANRFSNVLEALGVEPEERVLIALPDGEEFVGAFFGVLQLGAVVVMVNPGFRPEVVAQLYDYTAARAAVVDAAALETFDAARGLADDCRIRHLLIVGGPAGANPSWELERSSAAASFEPRPTHRDDPAIWLFSGGTTGRPKGVVQPHRSFANTTELYAKGALGYRPDDVTLSVPKLYFGYATGSNLLFPFSVGASTVLFPEPPTPEILFEQIARHRPTILINVPTMVGRMATHPAAEAQDLSSLRFATSAGEALPVPLYERWKEVFGVELLDGLGTAEMWHIFLTNRPDDVRPGTLGRAVDGFEIQIRDDQGCEQPRGEVGRLWVRGGSRAIAYWRQQEKTEEAFQGEWFVGGDLARMDGDGYVTYCGRGDDVLKVGGKWCVPAEIEGVLMDHPLVRECAVIGADNEEGLTKPYAFVVAAGAVAPTSEDELKQFVLQRLAPYKHPRRVLFLDDFPRTHLGKVDRQALRRALTAGEGPSPGPGAP